MYMYMYIHVHKILHACPHIRQTRRYARMYLQADIHKDKLFEKGKKAKI